MKRLIVSVFALLLPALGISVPALAHDDVTNTSPTAGASVASPSTVVLTFSNTVDPLLVSCTLRDAGGVAIELTTGKSLGDGRVSMDVPQALTAGLWTATWRSMSVDSHPIAGSFSFNVTSEETAVSTAPASGSSSSPVTSDDGQNEQGGSPNALLFVALLGLLLISGVVGAVAARRR